MAKAVEMANIHQVAPFIIFPTKRKNQTDICSGFVLFADIGLSGLQRVDRRFFVAYTLKIHVSQLIVALLKV